MTKHIFITGGVVSSLGKGLTAASLGMLLEARGLNIRMQKLDPYLNVNPGMMSPAQHGEVYILDDGTEADLDLGHYERFTNSPLTKNSSWTSGKIYRNVLRRERNGKYRGQTVQVIPHVTNEIKRVIRSLRGKDVDAVLTEIGGTVGDIESLPFLEAIRQFALDVGRENCLFLHLTLLPFLKSSGELKTKPTQHSVGRLRQIGIQPDILICRTEHSLSSAEREKIALFCNLESRNVIEAKDAEFSIYEIPVTLQEHGLDQQIVDFLWKDSPQKHLQHQRPPDLTAWREMLDRLRNPSCEITIAVIGRYARHRDAYKSVYEALDHAGIKHRTKVRVVRMSDDKVDLAKLNNVNGILISSDDGGNRPYDNRGIKEAIQFAREQKTPFFGIGHRVQLALDHLLAKILLSDIPSQRHKGHEGGEQDSLCPSCLCEKQNKNPSRDSLLREVRPGAHTTQLVAGSKAFACYGTPNISERHSGNHCFVDNFEELQNAGLLIAGTSPDGSLVSVVELPDHPWSVGVQYHPEFKSQPTNPHPLFDGFVSAARKHGNNR